MGWANGNPHELHVPKPKRLQWDRTQDNMEWPHGLDGVTTHLERFTWQNTDPPRIRRRGETNRCASTVPMDAGYSTEYVSQSQLPAPNVLYDSVQLPQRNESKVVLGDSKDALKKTLKEAMQSTEAWKAAMSPRRDTRGLRQASKVQIGLPGPDPALGATITMSDRLRAALAAATINLGRESPSNTERPPSQASNSKEDEEEEGFEDPAAVLEHWTIKSGGQLQPRDDPRFQTLTKLAGGPTAAQRLSIPQRFPDAAGGGRATIQLGAGKDPSMYTTWARDTYGPKQRIDGAPGKRNDKTLPQHADNVKELRAEIGENGRGAWSPGDTWHGQTYKGHSSGDSPRRIPIGTFNKTASAVDVLSPKATTRLEDRTTYRDYFTETGVLRPPTRSLGVKATIDLTHGRNHAKTSAMRRAKALMEEQVREGTLSGR